LTGPALTARDSVPATLRAAVDAPELNAAAQALAQGRLVAFPTETVYGLGARADDDAAVAKIFVAKGRPADHPLIVHVASVEDVAPFVSHWPDSAQRLTQAFWPGPLTVIVPRAPGVARAAAGSHASIGLRCPAHPLALALLRASRALGVLGVAAPSANRFGRVSPTTAAHVRGEFPAVDTADAPADNAVLVLDGGPCAVGIESTIVDCTRERPVLLRPGKIDRDDIERVLGVTLGTRDAHSARASGTLEAHYAPRARVRLMSAAQMGQLAAEMQGAGSGFPLLGVYSRSLDADSCAWASRWVPMPVEPLQAAHELFSELRRFDDAGVDWIWVEELPAGVAWDGVRDRLQRAAAS
jgi:L-threonylcarbamoyladenylate synthase